MFEFLDELQSALLSVLGIVQVSQHVCDNTVT